MEATYQTKAIVLGRQAFKESDLKVTLYSPDKGKINLIARGGKKAKSKLAAHLEPMCLCDVMVVRGRQLDYLGSAISENCYLNIKKELDRLFASGKAFRIFNQLIKDNSQDKEVFVLLDDFLGALNQIKLKMSPEILADFFIFKLLIKSGYRPELYFCQICRKKINPGKNKFDLVKSGLVCPVCPPAKQNLTLSDDCIKILRLLAKYNFNQLAKIKFGQPLEVEIKRFINKYLDYQV